MLRSPIIFSTLFALICFYVFVYPVLRISQWMGDGYSEYSIGWIGSLVLLVISIAGMWHAFRGPKLVVRYFMVHWMGASFILASVVVGYELVRVITSVSDQQAVIWILGIAGILVFVAWVASHHLNVNKIHIQSDKLKNKYRVVQISDVHIGSRQRGFMQRVVRKINRLQPDYVVITGDLIDTSAVDIEDLEALKTLSARTFFCVGNHERYADLPKAIAMLEALGVIPLRQESQIEQELQFIGIDDADDKHHVAKQLPQIQLNTAHFLVLLYHRPVGFEVAARHGVDLMLSGHTHNGQIFPFNLLVRQQFARICGHYRAGDAHLYVNRGTGTWGPLMRLGSLNEISCFELSPKHSH